MNEKLPAQQPAEAIAKILGPADEWARRPVDRTVARLGHGPILSLLDLPPGLGIVSVSHYEEVRLGHKLRSSAGLSDAFISFPDKLMPPLTRQVNGRKV